MNKPYILNLVTGYWRLIASTRAYTLMEVVIASGIFAVTMMIVLSTFTINSDVRSKTQVIREASVSSRYAVEAIAREFRLAKDYEISPTSDSIILFSYNDQGEQTSREYIRSQCHGGANQNYAICVKINNTGNFQPMTSADINVLLDENGAIFDDKNSKDIGTIQPFLNISFKIKATLGKKKTDQFEQTIKTTIASRKYPGFNSLIPQEQQL